MTEMTPSPTEPPRSLEGLGARLRALREEAGLTQTAAAEHVGIKQNRVSRAEHGQFLLDTNVILHLAQLYQAPGDIVHQLGEWADALRPSREDSRLIFQRGTNHFQERVRRMEQASALVRSYQPGMVIGVLQTEAYATAVMGQRANPNAASSVRTRLARQQQLLDNENRQWVLVQTEGALRWPINSPEVMAEQLDRMIEISRRPNVRLGLISQDRPVDFTAHHGFHIYDQQAVHIGTKTASTLTSDGRDLGDYQRLFDRLEAAASWGGEGRAVIERVAENYRRLKEVAAPH